MLVAEYYEGEGSWAVEDDDGGIWWPSDEALAEIMSYPSSEQANRAIEIVEAQPMRGEWHA